MTDEPTAADRPRVSGYAWYALILFVIVYIFNFIDRQILSILAESIKADLKLDDAQIGFLYGTAFAVFYALFGIPLGRLADSWYRGRLMAIGLALWSSMTALSGFAQNFSTLAVARVGVGIGEASASPAAFSMIADYFPKERRATALSIYSSGLYIGGGLALPLGGFVLASWGRAYPNAAAAPLGLEPWQAAFVAVGLPGILLAAWIWSLKEPLRGAIDGHPSEIVRPNAWREFGRELAAIIPPLTLLSVARIPGAIVPNLFILAGCIAGAFMLGSVTGDWPQWFAWWTGIYAVSSWTQSLKHRDPGTHRLIWGTPQFVTLAIGFGSISFMTYAVAFWIPPYVLRTFYTGPTDAALLLPGRTAAEEVSTLFGWSAAFASAAGVILGGIVSDKLRRRHPAGRVYVAMASVVLPAPAVYFLFTTDNLTNFYLVAPYVGLCSALWVGAAVATLQDLVLPRMRGTAGATYVLGTSLVGLALGPYFSGKVAALTGSLATGIFALYIVPPFTLMALWLASRKLAELEATREERATSA
ncbi:spinster family MFS transporter [Sphingomonas daechungensis]|uniref:spinster family MFS transporter n=1 Tax=Sphingomonas daechungensis TaxID=1176646 RepID=UPI003783844D